MLAVRVNLQGVAIALCHGMGEAGGDGGPLAMVARVAAQGNIGVARADFRDPRGLRRAGAIIDDNDRKPLGPIMWPSTRTWLKVGTTAHGRKLAVLMP